MLKPRYIVLAFVLILTGAAFFWDTPVSIFESALGEHPLITALTFVGVMFLATVVAPVTALPLVPLLAPVLGPFLTGILSIIGWTLGAVVAFLIARHAGRPILQKFVSLETLESYESYIPKETRFLTVCMLRMLIPVDVLSYALGFFSTISLFEYTLATLVGVSWFSFAFAYLGAAAVESNMTLFISIGVASALVLGLSWWYVIQQVRQRDIDSHS